MDLDEVGEKLAAAIRGHIPAIVDEASRVSVQMPQGRGEDWNDVLTKLRTRRRAFDDIELTGAGDSRDTEKERSSQQPERKARR